MLKKHVYFTLCTIRNIFKALSIKINEDHKSQLSLFLVYILTLKYKEHIPKKSQSVHFAKTWYIYTYSIGKKAIKNEFNQN